ncbi:hypothetical protein Bca4012_060765 [Brassica carinata]|uniref:ELM2 domain-containing protein n=1 Tax=Brassica carinata TaxID=52824 RepID=A0A8X7V3V6_BRACI|nr:hypothetical protein Bca52824_031111 [Brassica carinata]
MDEENNAGMEDDGCEYVCGDPKVDIRVGDDYQAEIPPLIISESERAAYFLNPLLASSDGGLLLPVDITWIDNTKVKEDDDDNVDMSESLKSLKTKRNKQKMMNLEAVPERSSSSSWEDLEVDAFVLGLYTFGKNFTQIKQFLLESKETGQLLSFYYGKFYNSSKHKIWSNSLKKRKCIQGKKLYSGWRLHQLLSRLIPSIADESLKTKLVNVSKSFAEGNTSLEKYISAVKELVGLRSLVEAVAIGSKDNKKDLTVLTTEPVNSKQWFTVSSSAAVVPAGLGVYSSLTSAELMEKLNGGPRLSKARCNDIFWEAVWPRLLARGWHSEQPKDRGKDSNIVFLIPGIKKFSRRKLVKQNHYFDSISDIIKKVVSDPELLEFDEAAAAEIRPPPNGGIMEENQSKQSKRRYLKSPDSSSSTHMKFTVVDTTCLASGGKLCAFRELKNPNPESLRDNNISCVDVEKQAKECKWEKRQMKKLVEEPVRFMIVDTSLQSSVIRKRRRLPANESLCNPSSSQNETWEYPKLTGSGVKHENVRSKKRSVRKSESANNHSLSSFPLPKRRRLSACVRKDIERFGESSVSKTEKPEEAGDGIEILRPKTEPSELCSIHCSSKKQEALQEEESKQLCTSKDQFEEKLIQLPSMSGSDKRNSPSTDHGTTQETASVKQEEEEGEEENQQINTDPPRRQSSRKRPLTTRALEALESGFYTAKTLKSAPTPIKRERSARIKHSSTNASNRAQGESDNGFLVKETTSSKPLDRAECSEQSFLADKATATSKPVDQTEDSDKVTTEFPKRPPILLKLPFKRS